MTFCCQGQDHARGYILVRRSMFGLLSRHCWDVNIIFLKKEMKPKVIVEQLNPHEHVWDNSLLKLPTILSSPSLDCSSQYKEMLSIVAAELESEIQSYSPDSMLLVESPYNNLRNLNRAHKRKEIRIQNNYPQMSKHSCKFSSGCCRNAVQSKRHIFQPQTISDPFDDFVNLDDAQELLNNCNVFHNFTTHSKVEKSSAALSLHPTSSTIFDQRPPFNSRYPGHSESQNIFRL